MKQGDDAVAAEIRLLGISECREPVIFILRALQPTMEDETLERALQGSEAGILFADMRAARDAADQRRADYARHNDPAFVAAGRASKAAERQAAHTARLAAKALRDADRQR